MTERITPETFRDYGFFRGVPQGTWQVTVADGLPRWPEYRTTILLGICEVLSGALKMSVPKKQRMLVDYPPDFGQYGMSWVDIDYQQRTVFVRNMVTCQNSIMNTHR